MELHQLQVAYVAEHDRLLLRATFRNPDQSLHEVRAWLTRRILSRLWPGIVRALETKVTLDQPQAQHARRELVGMSHQASVSQNERAGNFGKKFEDAVQTYPLGQEPLLVSTVNFHVAPQMPVRIEFLQADGKRFEISFGDPVLHGFCKLVQDGAAKAEWGVELRIPGLDVAPPASAQLN